MLAPARLRFAAALLGGLLLIASAHAGGTAVRCGRTYQDRPCAGFQGKLVASSASQKKVSANQSIDPACRRRGASAQRYITARASGASEDEQLAGTTSPADKRLISEVYRSQGSAAEQREIVEANCMAERQRVARGEH
jgi:hypothetical protein